MVLLTDHERELLGMRNIPRKASADQSPAATPDPPTPPRPRGRGRGLTGRPKSHQSVQASGSASTRTPVALPPAPRVQPTQASGGASQPAPLPAPRAAPPSRRQPAPPIRPNASGKSRRDTSPIPSHRSRSTSGDPNPWRKDIPEQHDSVTPEFNIVGPREILSMPSQVKGATKARATHRKWDLTSREKAWLDSQLIGFKQRIAAKDHTAATWWKREVIPKFVE
ncbi:hypothetical protein BOTBODRAFT_47330 [Botryobasidium botryosum FD-172 SS1]|uniref:Uncharacterized protein n=1 Tax=Botryobasidium botryosum (strain FD-172 SS1) TaxID=930990 RepID=A0A067M284_BOTB1|nr:hypothetical protein BOTBODRAFT_47330 [Botryobasidium botryosum FD-172 SS1]